VEEDEIMLSEESVVPLLAYPATMCQRCSMAEVGILLLSSHTVSSICTLQYNIDKILGYNDLNPVPKFDSSFHWQDPEALHKKKKVSSSTP
jgi:hypothetical protein